MPNEQLDPQAKALAMAIRQHETGNRQVAGASGEIASRYQFLPSTWKSGAAKYLGDANAPVTLENENKVAYSQIKEWKDSGMNPGQIAAAWNAGPGSIAGDKWKTMKGTNAQGVNYDVPKYVASVYSNYQKLKPVEQQKPIQNQPQEQGGMLNAIKNIPTSLLRGVAQPAEFVSRLGTTIGEGASNIAAPFVRAGAEKLGVDLSGVGKAAAQTSKGIEGEKYVLPGQTDALFNPTTSFKSVKEGVGSGLEAALNVGLGILPAGRLGGTALKTAGVTGKALTAGKAFAPRLLEAGAVGSAYSAANALENDKMPTLGDLGSGFLGGAAFPVAGAGFSKISSATAGARDKTARGIINSLIKPLEKNFAYGKDPGAGALGIVAKDFNDLIGKLGQRVDERGAKIDAVLSDPKVRAQITPTIRKAFAPIDKAIQEAASNGDQAVVNRLRTIKDALMFEQSADADGNIIRGAARKVDYLEPKEIIDFKRRLGKLTKFTGNPSDDKAVNAALQGVYGNLMGLSEEAAARAGVKLAPLNQDFANSMSALIAAEHRDIIMQRQNLLSLANKLTSGAGIIASIMTGNPVAALLSGGAGVLLDKLLSSTAAKTVMAKWLMTSSADEKAKMFSKVPVLRNALDRIFGKEIVENPIAPESQQAIQLLLTEKAGPSVGQINLPSKGILEGQSKIK